MARSASTAGEVVKVYDRIARTSGTRTADTWIRGKGYASISEARQAAGATFTEADLNTAVTRAIAGADAARKARKAAKRAARESVTRRQITESLTAASGPQPPPGTGMAGGEGLDVQAPGKPLHQMSTDEFRAHAAQATSAYARAAGFRGPIWHEEG